MFYSCLQRYRNDIKKTWANIGGMIIKKTHATKYHDFFVCYGNQLLYDKGEIATKFNCYFIDIGMDLPEEITYVSDKNSTNYLIWKPNCVLFIFQKLIIVM